MARTLTTSTAPPSKTLVKVTILDHQNGSRKKNVKANNWKLTPKTSATLDQLHNILKFHHIIIPFSVSK